MIDRDAKEIHVSKIVSITLLADGLEIQLFRLTSGTGNADSGDNARHALSDACLTRATVGPAT